MIRFIIFIVCSLYILSSVEAQELNTKLTINTQKIQSADKELFSTLERNLNQMLNEQKWTDITFNQAERIDCNITLTINEVKDANTFSSEILVSSRRPVYNSTYSSPLINYRDTQVEFKYTPGESLYFNSMNVDNNLVAVISFYVYIIIGFDFDSFSMKGGSPYFARAMEIANMSQSLGVKGWEPFSGKDNNRYDLAVALTDDRLADFHTFWYNYHRLGLDEMAANPTRGRIRVLESVDYLKSIYGVRPSSILLTIIGESKLDEIVRITSLATSEEKQALKKLLTQIFPTKGYYTNLIK